MSTGGASAVSSGLLERITVIARAAGREILEVYTTGAPSPTAKAVASTPHPPRTNSISLGVL